MSRPRSNDADSFGKPHDKSKSPGKEYQSRNWPVDLKSQRPLSRIHSDKEFIGSNFRRKPKFGVLSNKVGTSDGPFSAVGQGRNMKN